MRKTKSFSHIAVQDALERLNESHPSGEELVYNLLRIFCGYGDGNIRRIRDGIGNKANDGRTILIPNFIAYRPKGELDFHDEIKAMKSDPKITKQSPRLYVVSDGQIIVADDPKEQDIYENKVALMWKDFEFFTPLAGIEKIQYADEAEADVKSAELMAKLFDDIRRYNNVSDPDTVHALNVFMSRLLFCFFAEDTGLFPGQNLFTNTLANHTKEDGSDLAEFIDKAFLAMSTNDPAVLATLPSPYDRFPYVNGGLFKDRFPIPTLSRRARTLILNCGEYAWKDINPDIFGSMIQAVVTPEQRAGLGIHYTSVPNIEKVIRPLFLDSLIEEYTAACEEAKEKLAKKMHPDRAAQRLRNLLSRLANIKFFDPACGSGNFLIITYKRLRELEIKIWQALRDIANISVLPISNVSLTQFYGIELDEYACDTATLSLWLAEHQMNVKFGEALGVQPDTLPLKPSGHIVCGNACRLDWNTVCPHTPDDEVYIMGNPPYVGARLQETSHKKDMQNVMGDKVAFNNLDYISSWFFLSSTYIDGEHIRSAFVTTNSLCQGEQVSLLWDYIYRHTDIEIYFGYKSFKWDNNAKNNAGVTCTIIGLRQRNSLPKYLIDGQNNTSKKVAQLNAYLVESPDIFIFKRTKPISSFPAMDFGSMPNDGGFLLLEKFEKDDLISSDASCGRFIHRIYGSQEFIRDEERYCIWIEEQEKDNLPTPILQRIERVRVVRSKSKRTATNKLAEMPWRFGEVRYKNSEAILIPAVSSERREYIPIGYVDKDTIISNSAFAIYDAELWLFALLTSKMHNLWVRTVGGRLKTDYRYSATLCYNTFPFPKLTTAEKEVLASLAQHILNIRNENYEMAPGEMYNPETMPDELLEAHHQLDLAVERIYRHEPFTSDEERLEYLFKLYVKMNKKD